MFSDAGRKGSASPPAADERWPILVINLDRSAERWRHSATAYADAGFTVERLAAIDGETLPADEIDRVVDRNGNLRLYKRPLTAGEIGCYLSHRAAWRRIANGAAGGGYVFEDDAVPTGLLAEAMALIEKRTPDWDVIKLFSSGGPRGRVVVSGALSLRAPAVLPASTAGYAVSRCGAKKLLRSSERFSRPLDIDIKHWWEKDLRVQVIHPSVLDLDSSHLGTSVIGPQRRAVRRNALTRFARNIRYQLRFRLHLLAGSLRRRKAHGEPGRQDTGR